MIKREYHCLVHVYKEGGEGKIYSQHSFTMWNRGLFPTPANSLYDSAIEHAIKHSDYGEDYDAAIVQSMSRIR